MLIRLHRWRSSLTRVYTLPFCLHLLDAFHCRKPRGSNFRTLQQVFRVWIFQNFMVVWQGLTVLAANEVWWNYVCVFNSQVSYLSLLLSLGRWFNNGIKFTVIIVIFVFFSVWAASWQNQQTGMCAQGRLRSAWASPSLIRVFVVR